MFATISLLAPPYKSLTYALPHCFEDKFWRRGLRICVPLGKSAHPAGIVCDVFSAPPDNIQCREAIWPLEKEPLLDDITLDMVIDAAIRSGIEPGQIWANTLPAGLKSSHIRLVHPKRGKYAINDLRELEANLLRELAIDFTSGVCAISSFSRDPVNYTLKVDPPWPVRPNASRQIEILDYLHASGHVSSRELLNRFGPTTPTLLKKLLANNLIQQADPVREPSHDISKPGPLLFELNDQQKTVLNDLKKALSSHEAQSRLLYGVTGSGKTAIYMELVQACIAQNKSVLLLAPEVALAHKLYNDFCKSGGNFPIYLYHGYQTQGSHEKLYRKLAAASHPALVIGTRSALFLPFPSLGCIILDEEHDSSFKQDENFCYHAKELAWYRMARQKGLLLLGSATPDIKTFYASSNGQLKRLDLPQRVSAKPLPPIEMVDIGAYSGLTNSGTSILAKPTENALQDCLRKGEQAIILLNRRGYAPMIYCLECAKTLRCPHCAIGLAYHKNIQRLVCHYCGYSQPYPSPCGICGKTNFLAIGEGTERIGEVLEAMSGKSVLRLDRDSVRRPERLDEILSAFGRGDSPFLVGTQMISKGHHFPNVTLVVVADGDIGINLPDYRASEKTFQLLVQAAGRAGRGDKQGRVLIQSRDLNHYCWRHICAYDYEGFYKEELQRRQKRLYPPFTKLAMLRISWPREDCNALQLLHNLGDDLRNFCQKLAVILLGPAPAPIAMLRGRMRYQCLLKSGSWQHIRQVWHYAKSRKYMRNIRLFLDLDPVDML